MPRQGGATTTTTTTTTTTARRQAGGVMGAAVARDKYELARQRIRDGFWQVDPAAGVVLGVRGQPIGYENPSTGYVELALAEGRRCRVLYRSRLIFEVVHGRIGDLLEVRHLNGVRSDDRASNLRAVPPHGNPARSAGAAKVPRNNGRFDRKVSTS